jgi:hypothetical protein
MRLGELLVRDRRISEAQLAEAMATQARDGGRIGPILLEMGLLDPESLTVYLGLELGLPVATGAALERCKRSAVVLLKPDQAARCCAVPIVIQGQTLLVAMSDPHDLEKLDAIAQLTGYRVIPRVAPEVRIYYYLERYYGVPRPARFAKYGEAARGAPFDRRDDLPALPLPGLPPELSAPASSPPPAVKTRRTPAATLAPFDQTEDGDDLVEELDSSDAESAPAVELEAGDAIDEGFDEDSKKHIRPATLTFEACLDAMKKAESRSHIADALLSFAAGMFDVALLLLVKEQLAFGWKGYGPDLTADRIESLIIPMEMPSIFQMAVHQDRLFRGVPSPSAIHSHLAKVLHSPGNPYCTVCVIEISGRPVNVLYGERRAFGPPLEDDYVALRKIMTAAEEAYVRLISTHKRKSRESETTAN